MGGMSDYALEVAMQRGKPGRKKKAAEPKNVPVAVRDTQAHVKIAECIKRGLNLEDAERLTLAWNAEQASPMKIGLLKQRLFLAYQEAGEKTRR